MNRARAEWQTAYAEMRRTNATGAALAGIICDTLGLPREQDSFYGERGPDALRMQQALQRARVTARPLFQSLAETVLNGFGSKNPWCRPVAYGTRAWRMADRARQLRDRMAAGGRLELDAGNWVRGVK